MADKSNGVALRDRPGMVRERPILLDSRGNSLYGDAFLPPKDPLDGVDPREIARTVIRDIPIVSIQTGDWTADGIRTALTDHTIGMFNRAALLTDAVTGDDRVEATLGSRTGGLFSQPMKHHVVNDDHLSRKVRRAWKRSWKKLCPQSVMSELMIWAVMLGFACAQVVWDTTVTPWQPYLRPWHPQYIMWRWDIRKYIALTVDGPVEIDPGNGKWFLFTPHGPYRGWMRGVLRSVAMKWFIKGLAWRDWARFNERHGLPIIKAEVPAAGDPIQKANFVASMRKLGQEAVVGLPQNVDGTGYDIDLLEARDRAWESFQGTIDRCDRSIVLPILWQNLTTEVKEGSYAAARVHGDVRQTAIEFDNETMTEAVYDQLARPFAAFNFGDPEAATRTTWDVTPYEDFAVIAETLNKLATALNFLRQAGIKVEDPAAVASMFGIDLGKLSHVDPTQVESREKAGEDAGLTKALKMLRRDFKSISREIESIKRAA
jgi:hypothetical protein